LSTKAAEVTEFYKQLSLLVKSNLPLPQGLYQLASNFRRRDFKKVLLSISEDTSKGRTLSGAMAQFPKYFNPLHIKMIECGEKNGTLSEILSEIAYVSRINQQIISNAKASLFYPAFILIFTATLMVLILRFVIPEFDRIFADLFEGERLPPITQFLIIISDIVCHNFIFICAIMGAVIIVILWLFSGTLSSQNVLLRFICQFPFTRRAFMNLNNAKFCFIWAVFMKNKMDNALCFETIAEIYEDLEFKSSLEYISRNLKEGKSLVEELKKDDSIPPLISLAVEHVPEENLQKELLVMSEMFRENATVELRKSEMLFEIFLIFIIFLVVGSMVLALFLPLISIYHHLGG